MLDMQTPEIRQDPYAAYEAIRRAGPVVHDSRKDVWRVGRYNAVMEVLKNAEDFSSKMDGFEASLIYQDGAAHARMRKRLLSAFSPARIAALDADIQKLAEQRVLSFAGRREFDFVTDLAAKIPAAVVAWMIGVGDNRLDDFRRWSDAIISTRSLRLRGSEKPHPLRRLLAAGWTKRARAHNAAVRLIDECEIFLLDHFERCKDNPGGGWVTDVLNGRNNEEMLSKEMLADIGALLIVAGTDSTTSLMGSAMILLARRPGLQEQLRADPELIPSFVEEVLRFESPLQRKHRIASRATTIGGVAIPAGATVQLLLGSANRDPERFENAEIFQVDRHPNHHIAFGGGPHFCLGAQLARLETAALVSAVLKHLPAFSIAEGPIDYPENLAVRGPRHLPVRLA